MISSTRSRARISSARARPQKMAAENGSVLRCACIPTRRFSTTVSCLNTARFWNVRAMPRRASAWVGNLARSRPSNRMRPDVGRSTALIRLKSVVLPAPLGPIRLQIAPASTSSETSLTATRPPKRLETPSSRSSGVTTATSCGVGSVSPRACSGARRRRSRDRIRALRCWRATLPTARRARCGHSRSRSRNCSPGARAGRFVRPRGRSARPRGRAEARSRRYFRRSGERGRARARRA